ncbi:MAG: hypothetical protein ACRELG_05630 [Gemmataceae bacterium]
MQRITLAGSIALLSLIPWLMAVDSAQAQDRAGAAMAGGQAMQPPPAGGGGGGGVIPPGGVPPGAGPGLYPPAVGNLSIGAMAVPAPSPIGYYAPSRTVDYNVGKFFYYPFYYFPHSYWPTQCRSWPERPGEPYMRPPSYMTYPPFMEPHWRYEWAVPQKYYRGFHFWLDQF